MSGRIKLESATAAFASRLLFRLRAQGPESCEWAFVRDRAGRVFAASAPVGRRNQGMTPVTELVQGVFERFADQSFFILRETIWSTAELTPVCRGIVRIAAKRAQFVSLVSDTEFVAPEGVERVVAPLPVTGAAEEALALWPESQRPSSDADFLKLAARLAEQVERGAVLHRYDRPIAALAVSALGEILAWSTNRNSRNKTLHAEFNLVRDWTLRAQRGLPAGTRIYSTLKPCRMCAGAIWQAADDPLSIRVVYAEDDLGPSARGTVFDEGSEERRRALQSQP